MLALCIFLSGIFGICLSQISSYQNYTNMPGIQIYHFVSSNVFLYSTLTGNSSLITVEVNMYTTTTQGSIDSSNGLFSGVGFGRNRMNGLDIILFTYSKGNFQCSDYYAPGELLNSDVSLGGRNDVSFINGKITSLTLISYRIRLC